MARLILRLVLSCLLCTPLIAQAFKQAVDPELALTSFHGFETVTSASSR